MAKLRKSLYQSSFREEAGHAAFRRLMRCPLMAHYGTIYAHCIDIHTSRLCLLREQLVPVFPVDRVHRDKRPVAVKTPVSPAPGAVQLHELLFGDNPARGKAEQFLKPPPLPRQGFPAHAPYDLSGVCHAVLYLAEGEALPERRDMGLPLADEKPERRRLAPDASKHRLQEGPVS